MNINFPSETNGLGKGQTHSLISYIQKQPTEVFCKIWRSYKFRKFHRNTPVLESHFEVSILLKGDSNTGDFVYCEICYF